MRTIAEQAAILVPLALALVTVAAGRVRDGRRRERLNGALHELRRPLQALALCASDSARGQVERAIEALAGLDRELNGGGAPPLRLRIESRALAGQAVARWREPARRSGRSVELAWRTGACPVDCDPASVSRALDNLIANSLEHGGGTITVEGMRGAACVRLAVTDQGRRGPREADLSLHRVNGHDPRRGHGLRLVAAVAAEHGGRFAACRHRAGACAVLELPLAQA